MAPGMGTGNLPLHPLSAISPRRYTFRLSGLPIGQVPEGHTQEA